MQPIIDFINDPLVAPVYALLVIALIDLVFGLYRAIQQGVFDWQKLPSVLDSVVLQKVIPMVLLGVAAFAVTDETAKAALLAAYAGASAAALTAEVAALIQKLAGNYAATRANGSK